MAKLIEITGKALSGEWGTDDIDGTGIPVLRTTNFTNDGIVSYENVVSRTIAKKNIEEKYLKTGDIIIEKSGGSDKQPVGRVVFYDGPEHMYLFNNFTGLLRVKDREKWDPKYIFYSLFFNYIKGGTKAYENKTTGLHNLKTDDYVSKYEVKEIDIERQRAKCKRLDMLYEIIRLQRSQIIKFDELIKSRFVEMFGDPSVNPKEWDLFPLLELGNCKNGMNFNKDETGVELKYLGVGDFQDKAFINVVEDLDLISLNEMPKSEYLLRDGDIVFVRSNGSKELVGRCLVIYPGDIPTTYSGFCIRWRKKTDLIMPIYLIYTLKCESIRQKMVGRGANIQNLNQQILGQLNIPVPPLWLQQNFATFVQEIDKSKSTVQKRLNKLQTLQKSLMQQYFG